MRRTILGILALLLFLGGVLGLWWVGGADRDGGAAASISIRAGVLLGAIWLAMPQLSRLAKIFPPWMFGAAGIGVVLLIVRPRLIGYVLPLFGVLLVIHFAGWLFRPSPQSASRGKRPSEGKSKNGPIKS